MRIWTAGEWQKKILFAKKGSICTHIDEKNDDDGICVVWANVIK